MTITVVGQVISKRTKSHKQIFERKIDQFRKRRGVLQVFFWISRLTIICTKILLKNVLEILVSNVRLIPVRI